MKLLLTGATGKVGQVFLPEFLKCDRFADAQVVALCNNRSLEASDRVNVVAGSMADPEAVAAAMRDVTHVVHLAAVKESPGLMFDVALKGLHTLLHAFRAEEQAQQFILLSGDCTVGHVFKQHEGPITEQSPRKAYPGAYAMTKVLEEVMLEQFGEQYGINWTTLRAPWVMEKDDFRFVLDLTEAQFGGPLWSELVGEEALGKLRAGQFVPAIRDADGNFLQRNFIHVDDLVSAILSAIGNPRARCQLFNISMGQPVNYGTVAKIVSERFGRTPAEINTSLHSNWMDNSKARMLLDWSPSVDVEQLIDRAWRFVRPDNDPRVIWYPG